MTKMLKTLVCALSLMVLGGSVVAAAPAPLDRTEMQSVRGEKKFINPGVLRRNAQLCSKRGASGANCKNKQQANPPSRGCSTITRCRR